MSRIKYLWPLTGLFALVISVLFLKPWLGTIVLAALMANQFYPLYRKLYRGKGRMAAVFTLLVSFLIVIIPAIIIGAAAMQQIYDFSNWVSQISDWSLPPTISESIQRFNVLIEPLTNDHASINETAIEEYLRITIPASARTMVNLSIGILANLPMMGIALLIYIFMFFEFLFNGSKLLISIKKVSPYPPEVTDKLIERINLMASAMVKGQFVIAATIAAFSAALLIPLGLGGYYFIFLIIFTVLNFIPLGSGIIFTPIVLFQMFTGQFWLGLIILILHYAFGNIDPLMRSKFIPKSINLSSAWTVVSTFCGIAYFGIMGVVYGPIIFIVLITMWQSYVEYGVDSKKFLGKKFTSAS